MRVRATASSHGWYEFVFVDKEGDRLKNPKVDFAGRITIEFDNIGGVPVTLKRVVLLEFPHALLKLVARKATVTALDAAANSNLPIQIEPHSSAKIVCVCSDGQYKSILASLALLQLTYSHGRKPLRISIEPGPTLKEIWDAFEP